MPDRDPKPANLSLHVPRILDLVDGLLVLVETIGTDADRRRAAAARRALAGKERGRG